MGTGIDQTTLSKLVEKNLSSIKDLPSPQSTSTKAFGGETRQGLETGPQTVFIGFGVSGAPSAELSALASYLSPKPAVKWSQGTSPISPVPEGASVQTVYLPYSDASLFGVLIQGETTGNVSEAARTVAKALKGISSVKSEEVKKSVAKAKFAAASAVEDSYGFVTSFGPKVRIQHGSYFLVLLSPDANIRYLLAPLWRWRTLLKRMTKSRSPPSQR